MKSIKTFENFNDPNIKKIEKISISTYILKSDFFALKPKKEKDVIKKIAGTEFLPDKYKKNEKGDFIIEVGHTDLKELLVPKKFIYEIEKKY